MKKFHKILLPICLCMSFVGCGKTETLQKETRTTDNVANQSTEIAKVNEQNLKSDTENKSTDEVLGNKSRILIAYFTRADNIKIDPDVDATSSASINKKLSKK